MTRPEISTFETDLLIVGGGGAAAMAALAAAEAGVKVSVVSKESSPVGGATIQASGGIASIFDPEDSPQAFYDDIMAGGGRLNDPALVKVLVDEVRPALARLESYGYRLDRDTPDQFHRVKASEGHTFARGYLDRREGVGFSHALGRALRRRAVDFIPDTIIVGLVKEEDQVVGALAYDLAAGDFRFFNAKAVLLATGGLGQVYQQTTNAASLTGDGLVLAWRAGAELVDMEMVQFMPLAFPYPRAWQGVFIGMCSLWGPRVRLFNGRGERYMARYDPERLEYSTRDVVARANYQEIREGRGTDRNAVVVDPTENDPDLLPAYQQSLPDIYSRVAQVFGREAARWQRPFEAIPSQHFFMGGVKIDPDGRTGVPGLFAVGEVSGGVHGANRLAGVALAEIFVFGHRVGLAAAGECRDRARLHPRAEFVPVLARQNEPALRPGHQRRLRPGEIRQIIRQVMWDRLGPVRERTEIEQALEVLEGLQKDGLPRLSPASAAQRYNLEWLKYFEAAFMLQTAVFVATAALARNESRGSHYRLDAPEEDDTLYNLVLGRDGAGNLTCRPEVREASPY